MNQTRINLDEVREIADAYESAVRQNADEEGRDLDKEALAAIIGAARCMSYDSSFVADVIREEQEAAQR